MQARIRYLVFGAALLVVALVLFYSSWRWWLRDVRVHTLEAPQVVGGSLTVRWTETSRLYFGSHVWGYGGGDSRISLTIGSGDNSVEWHGAPYEYPLAVQRDQTDLWVLSQRDAHHARKQYEIVLYRRRVDGWDQPKLEKFPKDLGVCNLDSKHEQWIVDQALDNRPPR